MSRSFEDRARDQVTRAKKNGTLHVEPCEVCGGMPSRAHHDDYSKPLDVRWLCQRHHAAQHNGGGAPKRATCVNGHARTGDNIYTRTRGNGQVVRHCRLCRIDAVRRYRQRQREHPIYGWKLADE